MLQVLELLCENQSVGDIHSINASGMSHFSKKVLDKLIPTAAAKLKSIVENQRSWFWGDSELKLRIRKYKKSGEE
jgi:hypothetical protein